MRGDRGGEFTRGERRKRGEVVLQRSEEGIICLLGGIPLLRGPRMELIGNGLQNGLEGLLLTKRIEQKRGRDRGCLMQGEIRGELDLHTVRGVAKHESLSIGEIQGLEIRKRRRSILGIRGAEGEDVGSVMEGGIRDLLSCGSEGREEIQGLRVLVVDHDAVLGIDDLEDVAQRGIEGGQIVAGEELGGTDGLVAHEGTAAADDPLVSVVEEDAEGAVELFVDRVGLIGRWALVVVPELGEGTGDDLGTLRDQAAAERGDLIPWTLCLHELAVVPDLEGERGMGLDAEEALGLVGEERGEIDGGHWVVGVESL